MTDQETWIRRMVREVQDFLSLWHDQRWLASVCVTLLISGLFVGIVYKSPFFKFFGSGDVVRRGSPEFSRQATRDASLDDSKDPPQSPGTQQSAIRPNTDSEQLPDAAGMNSDGPSTSVRMAAKQTTAKQTAGKHTTGDPTSHEPQAGQPTDPSGSQTTQSHKPPAGPDNESAEITVYGDPNDLRPEFAVEVNSNLGGWLFVCTGNGERRQLYVKSRIEPGVNFESTIEGGNPNVPFRLILLKGKEEFESYCESQIQSTVRSQVHPGMPFLYSAMVVVSEGGKPFRVELLGESDLMQVGF